MYCPMETNLQYITPKVTVIGAAAWKQFKGKCSLLVANFHAVRSRALVGELLL